MNMPLPERVNASRVITYDVGLIKESLMDLDPEAPFTDEEIMEYIFDTIAMDFDGFRGVIIQDQDGNEL
jgi:hypothetical protein